MKEALQELLQECELGLLSNRFQCITLMKEGKEWEEHARKGIELKAMIEATILEIKRYTK